MKKVALVLMVLSVFAAVGCARKTATEQMQDDMKKASDKLQKDMKNL